MRDEIAGTLVDLTSGVTLGSVFDPEAGTTPGPFTRYYTLAIQALKLSDHVAEALIARGGADGLSGTHGRTRVTRR